MLKKYQVLETECGEFGVFNMETIGDNSVSLFKSEYAAEAQEYADEKNASVELRE